MTDRHTHVHTHTRTHTHTHTHTHTPHTHTHTHTHITHHTYTHTHTHTPHVHTHTHTYEGWRPHVNNYTSEFSARLWFSGCGWMSFAWSVILGVSTVKPMLSHSVNMPQLMSVKRARNVMSFRIPSKARLRGHPTTV